MKKLLLFGLLATTLYSAPQKDEIYWLIQQQKERLNQPMSSRNFLGNDNSMIEITEKGVFEKEYHANGKLKELNEYLDSNGNGIQTTHWQNGSVKSQGELRNGMRDGFWMIRDQDGSLYRGKCAKNKAYGYFISNTNQKIKLKEYKDTETNCNFESILSKK